MTFLNLKDIHGREIIPGYIAKLIHSENMTCAFWEIEMDAPLPLHSHVQEQICVLLDGEFELTIGDQTSRVKPGMVAVIPSNVKHSGKAITACKILDIFSPVREDYK